MRFRIFLAACLLTVTGCGTSTIDKTNPSGQWTGKLGGIEIHAAITGDTTFSGRFVLPDLDETVITPIAVDGDSVSITFDTRQAGRISLTAAYTDTLISGVFPFNQRQQPFFLRRITPYDAGRLESLVGWYANASNDSLLFTFAPHDGLYFFDFNGLAAGARYPVDDSTLVRLDDLGQINVIFRIRGDKDSTVLYDATNDNSWYRLPEQPFEQKEMTFPNGDISLTGVRYCPTGDGPFPGIVYIHGSGGNNTRIDFHDMYMLHYLAMRGIAVFVPDKRGCGESSGDWQQATFDDLAGDALAAVEPLAGCSSVDPDRIGLFGFSQGGWIAPLAATQSDRVAFIVNGSGSAVRLSEQLVHEMHNTFVNAGLTGSVLAQYDSLQVLAEAYVNDSTRWSEYASLRSRLAEGDDGQIAAGFPDNPGHWRFRWARLVGDFDPMPSYRKLDVPAFVLYGAEDESDNVPVGESVKRLNRLGEKITVKVYDGSGHALGDPTGEGYVRTDALDDIAAFVKNEG